MTRMTLGFAALALLLWLPAISIFARHWLDARRQEREINGRNARLDAWARRRAPVWNAAGNLPRRH